MIVFKKLIPKIKSFDDGFINKQDKKNVKEQLELISNFLGKDDASVLKEYIKVLNKGRLTKDDKKHLLNLQDDVIEIITISADKFDLTPMKSDFVCEGSNVSDVLSDSENYDDQSDHKFDYRYTQKSNKHINVLSDSEDYDEPNDSEDCGDRNDYDDQNDCEIKHGDTEKSINNLTVDDVETFLDKKIKKYNGFSEHHPMEGVSYNVSNKKYNIVLTNLKSSSRNRKLACKKILDHKKIDLNSNFACEKNPGHKKIDLNSNFACEKNPGHKKIDSTTFLTLKSMARIFFIHRDEYFMIYKSENNEYYFDILHIITILKLVDGYFTQKYNEYKSQVKLILPHINEFDGYIFRELINQETMHKILSSSSVKTLKHMNSDIGQILADLHKNDNSTSNKDNKTKNQSCAYDQKLTSDRNYTPYSYDNEENMLKIRKMIHDGSKIALFKYSDCPVLYAVILPLERESSSVIIKFGYSDDILMRIDTLKSEYKCNVYLIALKFVKSEKTEKKFHTHLRKKYPDYVVNFKIGGKDKVELYELNDFLLNEFNAMPEYLTHNTNRESEIRTKTQSETEHSKKQLNSISNVKSQYDSFTKSFSSTYSIGLNNDLNNKELHQIPFKQNYNSAIDFDALKSNNEVTSLKKTNEYQKQIHDYDQKINDLLINHKNEVCNLMIDHKKEIDSLRSNHKNEVCHFIEQMRSYDSMLEKMNRTIDKLTDTIDRLNTNNSLSELCSDCKKNKHLNKIIEFTKPDNMAQSTYINGVKYCKTNSGALMKFDDIQSLF
jgi:hypothetical protein